ncbi:hypothetical protein PIB30_099894, partial [Stylosanthes scabra]|nr:hypothetical protein [Stylosanthes scabra]
MDKGSFRSKKQSFGAEIRGLSKSRRGLSKSRHGTQSLGMAKLIPSIQSPRLGARSSSLGVGTLKSSNQAL